MTTAAKSQKDKPFGTTPRLMPRPTAASAARAARNATNRNLSLPTQRQSPTRNPNCTKGRTPLVQRALKSDSRTDVKTNGVLDCELLENQNVTVPPPVEAEPSYIIENTPIMIIEETSEDQTVYDGSVVNLQDINENCPLEIKNNDGNPHDVQQQRMDDSNESQLSLSRKNVLPESRSRPHTPALNNRPQTPRSLQSSRPQTPRMPSRPTTPAHPVQRLCTSTSRPNTPQRLPTPTRPKTPSLNVPPSSRVLSPASMCSPSRTFKEDDDIKSAFLAKQRQFHRMKKELDLKQQAVLELFDNLRGLRERMTQEGVSGCGEGLQLQELVVFNVADWTSDEIAQLCRDAIASATTDGAVELINTTLPIDECALAELDSNVTNVPTCFADLCLQAFTARQEIIDWVKELIERSESGNDEVLQRIARYNAQGLELCESLRDLKSRADDAVNTVSNLSKKACRERSALVAVGESLVREIARLRQDLETRTAAIIELQETTRIETERNNSVEEMRRELEEEKAAKIATKEKLAATEVQVRQTRMRISKMDRQLREAEASIASLTGTVKTLEDQSRQREVQLEARARKLKESLKTGEVTSSQLAQQRDSLQTEIQELKQQIEALTAQNKSTIHDLTNQLKEFKNNFEEQRKISQKEIELKEAAEAALSESRNNVEELKAKITELENNRPNPDLPTEREIDLWSELHAIKDILRVTEDEVTSCKREKVRFLETLTKITESDNKVGMQQKLAAELLSKEEILGKMQIQIRDLTKNIKLNEQKVIQYEQYVRDLQAHNRAVANCQEAPNGISYQDLQQEIMNLRMGLLEAVHRNEELSELLVQKEQQLEQQDKTSRAQVREELINMLKNKETEQSRELAALQQDLEHRMKIVDEVNKQIAAKAEEIQELFATLENKQQQIHRLEKIVLALEEQQRRAQAQRTRHEEKIAALEHELAASGNRRERANLKRPAEHGNNGKSQQSPALQGGGFGSVRDVFRLMMTIMMIYLLQKY
ncbi:myosin heavy chain, striated muscle-like isoform X2 [Spodoptera litura]|uniref:Myosin heavy chain, striated muscle-like isoform X2 n=1 Tax=Spodoptera litura TaxID=69820 RepID=A0A9J7IWI4_SPOLT|nr:myosin heavy chain, striated muscle-like isoform X2 [Spodoptera litura]